MSGGIITSLKLLYSANRPDEHPLDDRDEYSDASARPLPALVPQSFPRAEYSVTASRFVASTFVTIDFGPI